MAWLRSAATAEPSNCGRGNVVGLVLVTAIVMDNAVGWLRLR